MTRQLSLNSFKNFYKFGKLFSQPTATVTPNRYRKTSWLIPLLVEFTSYLQTGVFCSFLMYPLVCFKTMKRGDINASKTIVTRDQHQQTMDLDSKQPLKQQVLVLETNTFLINSLNAHSMRCERCNNFSSGFNTICRTRLIKNLINGLKRG